jgi:hypothetical protein
MYIQHSREAISEKCNNTTLTLFLIESCNLIEKQTEVLGLSYQSIGFCRKHDAEKCDHYMKGNLFWRIIAINFEDGWVELNADHNGEDHNPEHHYHADKSLSF